MMGGEPDHGTDGVDAAVAHGAALVHGPIDVERLRLGVAAASAGATVVFVGSTRRQTGSVITDRLEYEAHEPLAVACLRRLVAEAVGRFSLQACRVVHRVGIVPVGEESVAVAASSSHRRAAFEATAWLMDRIKQTVPIWKREHSADGSKAWVHTGDRPSP
jgi:molybdopterin synthase catalytic subunit